MDTTMADGDAETPTRMATRGGQRINYAELNSSGGKAPAGDEPAEEAVFRTPTASTRGRKRRITNDDGNASEFSMLSISRRGRPRGSGGMGIRGGRGGGRRPIFADADERGLMGAVRTGKFLEKTVDEWVSSYEDDADKALLALQQLFISASGCKGILTTNMLATMEYKDIIRRMTEDFDEESGDYPLVMAGPQYKKFRANFSDFLMLLVSKCKTGIIFDGRMMDPIVKLLTGLADSQVRAFRHTSTFAAMKLASALVDVTIELATLTERNLKQVEAETAKVKQQKATTEKLDALVQKKAEIKERTDDVRLMVQYIFKSVCVHRYRDLVPDIRAICISELGNWMDVYPVHFLDDSYLKYIGWSLYDKVPDVRNKCLTALLPLYGRSEVAEKLELFTHKFKERLVSMVMDREHDVGIKACQLMTAIYRMFPTLLTVKDCVPVYELVYANHRGHAVAAGEFLNTKVFQRTTGSKEEQAKLILDLVHFFIEGEVHDNASYLVDALIETNPMLKEWKIMVDILLTDDAEGVEAQLLDILACAVKQAATAESPVGRAAPKRGPAPANPRELKNLKEERTRISEVLIPTLPQLIHKFIADRDKVANLMSLPIYFQLEHYMASHGEKHLKELMEAVKVVMERHADDEILSSAADLIDYLTSNTLTSQQTESFRIGLLDRLSLELRTAVGRFNSESQLDEEDEAALLSALRKMLALLSHLDLRRWELWDTVSPVVAAVSEGKACSSEVLETAIHILSLSLQYELQKVTAGGDGSKPDAVKKLKKKRDQFVCALENILSGFASCVETAFNGLADVLICFNGALAESDQLKSLQLLVSKELASKMQTFVNDNVFCEAAEGLEQTAEIELMYKKRSLLTQFCKLVLHGVLPFSDAAPLLTHYVEFYGDFGDVLKLVLYKTRDMDKIAHAKCIVQTLQIAYENAKNEAGSAGLEPESEAFSRLRELAKRLSISLGNDHIKNRDPLAVIHRDGMLFALETDVPPPSARRGGASPAPPHLPFLEIILEFSYKLLRQDKLAILRYLEKHSGVVPALPAEDSIWQPYLLYKSSLVDRGDDASSMRSGVPVGRGRGRGRPRGSVRGTPAPSEI